MDSIEDLLTKLKEQPEAIAFRDVIALIDSAYEFTPCAFSNGPVANAAGTNEGSCKILAFAKLQQLEQAQTLALFGHYYRDDVLAHPDGVDHANIRQFMQTGWAGVRFDGTALKPRR